MLFWVFFSKNVVSVLLPCEIISENRGLGISILMHADLL
ncbi:hypothetical protein GLYMA_19G079551v4 [Glycine max]|nr:hypothetical protein GLYMA_19G079551v4 [Glycine max]KAH1076851.1 hypothetical protein GYH30_052386 [Glycine max]